jgi:hypothetical protein
MLLHETVQGVSRSGAALSAYRDAALERLLDAGDAETHAADPARQWQYRLQKQEIWDALQHLSREHHEVLYSCTARNGHSCESPTFYPSRKPPSRDAPSSSRSAATPSYGLVPTIESKRLPKGNTDHDPSRRGDNRNTTHSPNAQADAPSGRALEPDRRTVRRSDRCDNTVQPHPGPTRGTWRGVGNTISATSAGRLI